MKLCASFFLLYFHPLDFLLQVFQKAAGMTAVHLGVVELEGDGEGGAEEAATVFPPNEEGVVVATGILVHDAVEFRLRQCRRAHNHAVFQRGPNARPGSLGDQFEVIFLKLGEVVGVGNVAQGDAAFVIQDNDVDAQQVVAEELFFLGQQIELLYPAGRLADAPAEKHVKLHTGFPAQPAQMADIEGLHQRHHRHGR